jgi:hypothetical protein
VKVDAGAELFDPLLDDVDISSIDAITKSITKEFVLDNFITVEFCDFGMCYASQVSHSKDEVLKILEASGNDKTLFDVVSASDFSWAYTGYSMKRMVWEWKHQDDKKKARNATRAEQRKTKGRGRGRVEDDEELTDKPKKMWFAGNRSKKVEWGLPPEGRAMYLAFKKAFKDVGRQAWAEVWAEYWEKDCAHREAAGSRKRKISDLEASGQDDVDEGGDVEAVGCPGEIQMSDDEEDMMGDDDMDGSSA